ncbi:MAG: hypothetical protein HGB34_01325 [Candidatus Moranbacteria bacterium]|nr:hypothetical protein [Candidatus Moranbacteria bacterium]
MRIRKYRERTVWVASVFTTFFVGSFLVVRAATVYETRYETRQVEKTVVVTPEEYRTDRDGDGLVDAIDPDPSVHQWEYFTDTDGDAVPDAFDLHHDEDDLSFFENGDDLDSNGIVDAYERS